MKFKEKEDLTLWFKLGGWDMEGVFIFICIPMQLQTMLWYSYGTVMVQLWYSYACEIILHYIFRNEI
jgi:hypothetical protein